MPRTEVTVLTPTGSYSNVGRAVAFTAADVVNKNCARASGNDLILVRNTHETDAKAVTITSQADSFNRTRDITESLAAGTQRMYGPFKFVGWRDTSGFLNFEGASADVEFAVIEL